MRVDGCIYKEHLIQLNQDDYPFFCTILDEMDSVRINVDLEILKYELAEKIFSKSRLKLDLSKKVLYLHGHAITPDGFIEAENSYGNRHILYSEILRIQEICYDYKYKNSIEYEAGKYITIEPRFCKGVK